MKIKGKPNDLYFKSSQYGCNFHIGSLPSNAIDYDNAIRSNVKILHYGYFDDKLRSTKFKFYSQNDPNSHDQDNYRHIISDKSTFSGPRGFEFRTLPDDMFIKDL
jgi:hypothetical protein